MAGFLQESEPVQDNFLSGSEGFLAASEEVGEQSLLEKDVKAGERLERIRSMTPEEYSKEKSISNKITEPIQGALRFFHTDTELGEKDAEEKLELLRRKQIQAKNKFFLSKGKRTFNPLFDGFELSQLKPSQILQTIREEKDLEKEWKQTPEYLAIQAETIKFRRQQNASPKERAFGAGLANALSDRQSALNAVGATEEDIEEEPDAFLGGRVIGEVSAFVGAAKVTKGLLAPSRAKLIKGLVGQQLIGRQLAQTGLPLLKKPELISKAFSGAKGLGTFLGVKSTIQTPLRQDITPSEKVKTVGKAALEGVGIGAAFPVVGAGIGKTIGKTSELLISKPYKFTRKVLKKYLKHVPFIKDKRGIKAAQIKQLRVDITKATSKLEKMKEFKKASPEVQEAVKKWYFSQKTFVDAYRNVFRLPHNVLTQSGANKLAHYKLFLEKEARKAIGINERFLRMNHKTLKALPKASHDKITDYLIGLKKVKLSPQELKVAKDGDAVFKHWRKFVSEQTKIPMKNLEKNYVPTYYTQKVKDTLKMVDDLGGDDKAAAIALEKVFNKKIPLEYIQKIRKAIPTNIKISRFQHKKLPKEISDLFREKDITKLTTMYSKDMAKAVENKRMVETLNSVLKLGEKASAKAGVTIPEGRKVFLQQMIKSYETTGGTVISDTFDTYVKDAAKQSGIKFIADMKSPSGFLFDKAMEGAVLSNLGLKASFAVRNVTQQSLNLWIGVPIRDLATSKAVLWNSWNPGNKQGFGKIPFKYRKFLAQSSLRDRVLGKGAIPTETALALNPATGTLEKVRHVVFSPVTWSDRGNVQTTMIAARLWAERLKMPKKVAIDFADDVAAYTQFLYSTHSRPLFTKTPLGRALFTFRGWPVNYLDLMVNGKATLYRNYSAYLPKHTLGRDALNFTEYLIAQYGAIAALQNVTGLDISSADPVSTVASIFTTPLDWMKGNTPIQQFAGNFTDYKKFYKNVPGYQITDWLLGKRETPFGRTVPEARKVEKRFSPFLSKIKPSRLIPDKSDN